MILPATQIRIGTKISEIDGLWTVTDIIERTPESITTKMCNDCSGTDRTIVRTYWTDAKVWAFNAGKEV